MKAIFSKQWQSILRLALTISIIFTLASCTDDNDEPPVNGNNSPTQSTESRIVGFTFLPAENVAIPSSSEFTTLIDDAKKEIKVVVSLSFYTNYLTSLKPSIAVSEKATISPSGIQDFSKTVTYTVVAEDGSRSEYKVSLILSEYDVLASILLSNSGMYPQSWVLKYANKASLSQWDGVVLNDQGSVIELDLNNTELTTLTERIKMLPNLQKMDLGNNRIKEIPSSIGDLKNLTFLNLTNNDLFANSLPDSFSDLTALESLGLGSNKIGFNGVIGTDVVTGFGKIPPGITSLENLKVLSLANNELTDAAIPDEFWNLNKLERLQLNGNSLSFLPDRISELVHLKYLWLQGNILTSLPPEIGDLQNLLELEIKSNVRLTSIPSEICDLTINGTTILKDSHTVCK